jgi:hypothetical protein
VVSSFVLSYIAERPFHPNRCWNPASWQQKRVRALIVMLVTLPCDCEHCTSCPCSSKMLRQTAPPKSVAAAREGGSRMPTTHNMALAIVLALPLRWLPAVGLSAEFLHNVAWLLLALGALGLPLASGSDDSGRRCTSVVVSAVCVFVLLFPIISANDDRAQRQPVSDTSTSQLAIKSLDSGKQTPVYSAGARRPVAVAPPPAADGLEAEVGGADHCFAARTARLNASGIHSPPCC